MDWRKRDYNPPLFDIMIRPFTVDKSFNEYSPRAVAAVGGCLFLLLMFFFGKTIAGSTGALWALGISVASLQVLYYSQEARPYSWVLAMATWCALSTYKLFAAPSPLPRGRGIRLTLQCAVAASSILLLHYQGAVFIAFGGVLSLYWSVINKRLRYFAAWALLVLSATAFWLPTYALHSSAPPDHLYGPSASLFFNVLMLFKFAFNDHKVWATLALLSLFIFLLFSWKKRRPEIAQCLLLIFGPMLFVHFYHAAKGLQSVTPRHLIVTLPFIYLLTTIMLSRIRIGLILSCVIVASLVAASFYDTVWNKNFYAQSFKEEDARGIAQYIVELESKYGDSIHFALRAWTNSAVNLYLELFKSDVRIESFLFCADTQMSPLDVSSPFVAVIQSRNCPEVLNLAEVLPKFTPIETLELKDRSILTVLTHVP